MVFVRITLKIATASNTNKIHISYIADNILRNKVVAGTQ